MTRYFQTLLALASLACPVAADSLYDAAAAAARQAAAQAVLAAEPGPSGPSARADGVRCTAASVGLRHMGAGNVDCTADSVTVTLHGDPDAVAALLRWAQIDAAAVAAP